MATRPREYALKAHPQYVASWDERVVVAVALVAIDEVVETISHPRVLDTPRLVFVMNKVQRLKIGHGEMFRRVGPFSTVIAVILDYLRNVDHLPSHASLKMRPGSLSGQDYARGASFTLVLQTESPSNPLLCGSSRTLLSPR